MPRRKSELPPPVRKRGGGHPFLSHWPKGVFCPAAVGVVHGYPKTEEAFKKKQEWARNLLSNRRAKGEVLSSVGVPKGWRHKKKGAIAFANLAKYEAKQIMEHMKKQGLLVAPDNELANEALMVAVEMHRNPLTEAKLRLAAAQTVLTWTKAKPAQRVEATVRTAEDFLAEVAEDALKNVPAA